jgi:hypothetical protein
MSEPVSQSVTNDQVVAESLTFFPPIQETVEMTIDFVPENCLTG